MRSAGASWKILFCYKPRIKPPNIASSIYFPTSCDGNILAVLKGNEVTVVELFLFHRPMFNPIGGNQLSSDLNNKVSSIFYGDRERIELLFYQHCPIVAYRFRRDSLLNCLSNCLLILFLCNIGIFIRDCSEFQDILEGESQANQEKS